MNCEANLNPGDLERANKAVEESLEGFEGLKEQGMLERVLADKEGGDMLAICHVYRWQRKALETQAESSKNTVRVHIEDFNRMMSELQQLKRQRDELQARGSEMALERQAASIELKKLAAYREALEELANCQRSANTSGDVRNRAREALGLPLEE